MDKLYVVVRADIPPGDQAVQAGHAAIEFMFDHPEMSMKWHTESNYIAYLAVPNEAALLALYNKALDRGVAASVFHEPAMNNELTAIALEPGQRSRRVCFGLPLTLA